MTENIDMLFTQLSPTVLTEKQHGKYLIIQRNNAQVFSWHKTETLSLKFIVTLNKKLLQMQNLHLVKKSFITLKNCI